MDARAEEESERLDAVIQGNEAVHAVARHWGVPTTRRNQPKVKPSRMYACLALPPVVDDSVRDALRDRSLELSGLLVGLVLAACGTAGGTVDVDPVRPPAEKTRPILRIDEPVAGGCVDGLVPAAIRGRYGEMREAGESRWLELSGEERSPEAIPAITVTVEWTEKGQERARSYRAEVARNGQWWIGEHQWARVEGRRLIRAAGRLPGGAEATDETWVQVDYLAPWVRFGAHRGSPGLRPSSPDGPVFRGAGFPLINVTDTNPAASPSQRVYLDGVRTEYTWLVAEISNDGRHLVSVEVEDCAGHVGQYHLPVERDRVHTRIYPLIPSGSVVDEGSRPLGFCVHGEVRALWVNGQPVPHRAHAFFRRCSVVDDPALELLPGVNELRADLTVDDDGALFDRQARAEYVFEVRAEEIEIGFESESDVSSRYETAERTFSGPVSITAQDAAGRSQVRIYLRDRNAFQWGNPDQPAPLEWIELKSGQKIAAAGEFQLLAILSREGRALASRAVDFSIRATPSEVEVTGFSWRRSQEAERTLEVSGLLSGFGPVLVNGVEASVIGPSWSVELPEEAVQRYGGRLVAGSGHRDATRVVVLDVRP